MLITASELSDEIITLGDMNVDYADKKDNKCFKEIVTRNGFVQQIKTPTRITDTSSSLIDIILINNDKNVSKMITAPLSVSDHDLIGCVRKLNNNRFQPRTITCRNYKNYEPANMRQDLLNSNFDTIYEMNNANLAWEYLFEILTNVFNKHAPKITKRVKGRLCPWLTAEIKEIMNNRDQILRRFRKHKQSADWELYKTLRNTCTNQIRKAKSEYYQNLLEENRKNPNSFWKTIKKIFPGSKTKTNTSPSHIKIENDDQNISTSNVFCKFFSTVATKMKMISFPIKNFIWTPCRKRKLLTDNVFTFTHVSKILR